MRSGATPLRMRATCCLVAGAFLLSACTSSSTDPDPLKRGIMTVDPGPVSSTAPTTHFGTKPFVALTSDQSRHLTSLPWALLRVRDGGRSLDIGYIAGGGCTSWRGFEVVETNTSVEIAALAKTTHPSAGQACSLELAFGSSTVPLASPMGTRKLLHGQVDPAWRSETKFLT